MPSLIPIPSESLHSTLKITADGEVQGPINPDHQPLALCQPSVSPIPATEPVQSELNENVDATVKKPRSTESRLRREIIQDVSIKLTSALQMAIESLAEDGSEDSFEHIESDDPPSPTIKSKSRSNGKES